MFVVVHERSCKSSRDKTVNFNNGRKLVKINYHLKALPRPARLFENSNSTYTELPIDQQSPLFPLVRCLGIFSGRLTTEIYFC